MMRTGTFSNLAGAALLLAVGAAGEAGAADQTAVAPAALRIDDARIERMLASMVADGRVAGASVLVWQGGDERYFGAAGFADREAGRPMTRNALVQIYSMTKPVTGVALMQLWEQGKFGLDDPLARHLPEFADMRVYDGTDAAGDPIYRPPARPILIRDIMRHTAGFSYGAGDTPVDEAFRAEDPLALGNDLSEMGRRLARVPLLFDPGEQWHYSAAVDVQALLVERLSGEPFQTYVRRHVLEPLGMDDTGWTQPPGREARLAATYVRGTDGRLARQPGAETRALNFGPRRLTMGGAGLASTIDDYIRFARMLLNGGALDGVRILKPSTVKLMATDQLDPRITERHFLPGKGAVGFGLDFAVRTAPPQNPEENRGAVGEFFWDGLPSTLFWVDPANDMAVVFLTQTLPFDGTLHHDIREAVYGAGYAGPPEQAVTLGASNYAVDMAMSAPAGAPAFADEFDGKTIDRAKWRFDTSRNAAGWHNNELQYYSEARPENARIEDGALVIEARRETLSKERFADWGGQAYSSARLVSREPHGYGFYEIRAKLPCGRGAWPAIWLLPIGDEWPDGGEIDIMEMVGWDPNVIHATLHSEAFNHARGTQRGARTRVPTSCTAFHRYQLDWRPDSITIGVDGRAHMRVENDRPGDAAAWPFVKPYELILNLAVGGDWAGQKGIDDAAFPQRMTVDYVRHWAPAAD